ncbi:hypothetical protein F2P56_034228 [Juglans regia]|uniref:Uncharacterized protein LOC108986748 n=2 Tax=Juglans regia TaxID=51240 RepID=A0A2I4E6K5_JUGRE|nr:uncharacterized protein LOC108986748 [Juglans regia]KAF5445159.1 hypothetical protein F2P56_034228 [Juglans regia]
MKDPPSLNGRYINKDMMAAAFGRPKKKLPPTTAIRRNSESSSFLLLSATSLASVESLSMPLVQEVVLSADIRCAECQRRVADIMSRMNETQSVVVNLLEKKVILTYKNASAGKASTHEQAVATIYRNPLSKVAIIRRIFRSSR